MSDKRTALVAGGTGGIGEGIVKVLMEADYRVFVPIRKVDRSERLTEFVADAGAGELHLVHGDLSDSISVASCRREVLTMAPRLDLVVVSVGSSYYGYSLHKIPRTDWDRLIAENLITHFNIQHEFLDQLYVQDTGIFVTLTGPEANFVHPETGLMSVVSAAQKMMTRVAAQEAFGTGIRIYSITSNTPVASRSRGGQVSGDWIRSEDIGRYILFLSEHRLPNAGEILHELQSRTQLLGLMK